MEDPEVSEDSLRSQIDKAELEIDYPQDTRRKGLRPLESLASQPDPGKFLRDKALTTADLQQSLEEAFFTLDLSRLQVSALRSLLCAAKKIDGTWVPVKRKTKKRT